MLKAVRRGEIGITFVWESGLSQELSPRQLRIRCPCAACVSEVTGERTLDPATIPSTITLQDMKPVGNYAYRILFGDGHDTGIFTLETLKGLCESPPSE